MEHDDSYDYEEDDYEDTEDTDELGDDGVELWLPGEGQV